MEIAKNTVILTEGTPSTPLKDTCAPEMSIASPADDIPDEGKDTWRDRPSARNSSANDEFSLVPQKLDMADVSTALEHVAEQTERDTQIEAAVSHIDINVSDWNAEDMPQDTSVVVEEAAAPQDIADETAEDVPAADTSIGIYSSPCLNPNSIRRYFSG